MILTIQVPTEVRGRPRFEEVAVTNVPRVGDTVDVDDIEYRVTAVLWKDLMFSSALIILDGP